MDNSHYRPTARVYQKKTIQCMGLSNETHAILHKNPIKTYIDVDLKFCGAFCENLLIPESSSLKKPHN